MGLILMEELRKPFFFAALGAMVLVLLVEAGAVAMLDGGGSEAVSVEAAVPLLDRIGIEQTRSLEEVGTVTSRGSQPGRGIYYLMLIDGIVLFTVFLMASSLFVRERIQGRVQGIATFAFSLLLVVLAITMIFTALAELTIMVSLLMSPPFGTAAYMAIYASFDRAGAAVALSALMTLKFAFVVLLILAQQRFLQNKGLITAILTSFAATVVVSFLHGIVPLFLVSITDAIAAIIVAILAVIWALVLLFGSIKSVGKAVGI